MVAREISEGIVSLSPLAPWPGTAHHPNGDNLMNHFFDMAGQPQRDHEAPVLIYRFRPVPAPQGAVSNPPAMDAVTGIDFVDITSSTGPQAAVSLLATMCNHPYVALSSSAGRGTNAPGGEKTEPCPCCEASFCEDWDRWQDDNPYRMSVPGGAASTNGGKLQPSSVPFYLESARPAPEAIPAGLMLPSFGEQTPVYTDHKMAFDVMVSRTQREAKERRRRKG